MGAYFFATILIGCFFAPAFAATDEHCFFPDEACGTAEEPGLVEEGGLLEDDQGNSAGSCTMVSPIAYKRQHAKKKPDSPLVNDQVKATINKLILPLKRAAYLSEEVITKICLAIRDYGKTCVEHRKWEVLTYLLKCDPNIQQIFIADDRVDGSIVKNYNVLYNLAVRNRCEDQCLSVLKKFPSLCPQNINCRALPHVSSEVAPALRKNFYKGAVPPLRVLSAALPLPVARRSLVRTLSAPGDGDDEALKAYEQLGALSVFMAATDIGGGGADSACVTSPSTAASDGFASFPNTPSDE